MKRIVFLASFVVITATDAILGFKTANSFGITEKPFALVFALGFALMSVPLKIIYERAVEVNYSKQYGGYIFGIFSIIWLLAFSLSLKGLGEYRVNNLVGKELENIMINLFFEYYIDNSIERQKELEYCVKQNIKNKFIDRIIIFAK